MNTVEQLIAEARRYGAELRIIDGRLKAVPPGRLPVHLKAELRSAAVEVKARLQAEPEVDRSDKATGRPEPEAVGPEGPYKARCSSLLPLDLETLADAIASTPRSPFLNELALARAARVAVESARLIRDLPEPARREVLALCIAASREAADAIQRGNYRAAYELIDALPDRVRELLPQ